MRRFIWALAIGALISVTASVIGCGSASNNDQGVSFSALGFFSEAPESEDDLPPGQIGATTTLSNSTETGAEFGGAIFTFLGLQNNLSSQFIRVERIFMSYHVSGASQQPPSTSIAHSYILAPPQVTGGEGEDTSGDSPFDSTLPPSFNGENTVGSMGFGQFPIVPLEVIEWLNFNRNSLPELPFNMTIDVYARGVTSAGDSLETNTVSFVVNFTPDQIINPTGGDETETDPVEETP